LGDCYASVASLVLKLTRDGTDAVSGGSEFHSGIVIGKNDICLYIARSRLVLQAGMLAIVKISALNSD